MLLSKSSITAAIAIAVALGGFIAVTKYAKAVDEAALLTEANERLQVQVLALDSKLAESELDKRALLADIKHQEQMFNDYLANMGDAKEQQAVVLTKLKEVFINEPVNANWGDTQLPADVKRVLLDATRTEGNNNHQASANTPTVIPP
ncbi:hypothetical protein [Pseudoalteromonas rhizosphaerae]|uniref:hypothetical protein n=1 Tax=Pseudoalteromonas rhizosphaerae TaxID=2518973 RepID=UPI001230C59C|nr:hypothetical protein [Pseudoalteromonas rhizosphaerae]